MDRRNFLKKGLEFIILTDNSGNSADQDRTSGRRGGSDRRLPQFRHREIRHAQSGNCRPDAENGQ